MRLFSDQAGGTRRSAPRPERQRATTLSSEGGRRGMALLMVLTTIAVLTTVVVEFAYDTRVDATLAANARDELRAHYMARSATNLSRLVLRFQYQLDQQLGGLGGAAGGMMPKIQLWKLIPVESSAINTFIGAISGPPPEDVPLAPSEPTPGERVPAAGLRSFGSYEGGFVASIDDEESKFNPNRLRYPGIGDKIFPLQIHLLWRDTRWDFLFERDNLIGERYNREDILLHLYDYVDDNEVASALDRALFHITDGVADELSPYTRYNPRYRPKNAPMDTVGELYLVPGFDDRLMAAFGDRFTTYTDLNSPVNINTDDPIQMLANIYIAARYPDDPALQNPAFIQQVLDQISLMKSMAGWMGMTVQQFAAILTAAGIEVRPEILNAPNSNDFLGDKSQTFRIEAIGQAGEVAKKITTVVRYDAQLGRLLYWRED